MATVLSGEMAAILAGDADAVARALDLGRPGGHVSGRIYISHAGSKRMESSCRLCGARVATWCGAYPKTQRAERLEQEHSCEVTSSQINVAGIRRLRYEAVVARAERELGGWMALAIAISAARNARLEWDRQVARQVKRINDRESARTRRAATRKAA